MIKQTKFNFDFANNRIKNLSDVIEEIKRKKDNNEDENKYLFDTLISLSETISTESNIPVNKKIRKNKLFKRILKPNSSINKKQNNKKNNNEEAVGNISKGLKNNKLKEKQFETKKLKKEVKENKLDKNINNINREKINVNKENTNNENEDFLMKRENMKLFNDDSWINNDFIFNPSKKLIFDNGYAFYFDDNYNYYNNRSIQFKEYYFNRNYEHPLIINKYFFS